MCYLWDETKGGRGANEIATAMLDYLRHIPVNVNHFSSYPDTYAGHIETSSWLVQCCTLCKKKIEHLHCIDLKFMESGHSYLEADSMHATIEHARIHWKVYTTREWEFLIRGARKKTHPYEVKVLHHTDFLDIKDLARKIIKNRTKYTDGAVVNWMNIKWLRFEKTSPYIIQYNYDIQKEGFMEIVVQAVQGRRRAIESLNIVHLYNDYQNIYEGLPAPQCGHNPDHEYSIFGSWSHIRLLKFITIVIHFALKTGKRTPRQRRDLVYHKYSCHICNVQIVKTLYLLFFRCNIDNKMSYWIHLYPFSVV